MVVIYNPFTKKENTIEKEMLDKELSSARSNTVLGASLNNYGVDEQLLDEKRKELLMVRKWLLDRNPQMQKLFLKLCGHAVSANNELKPIIWDTEAMTSLPGARKLVDYIETLDHGVMLSNWKDEPLIKGVLKNSIGDPLSDHLYLNYRHYKIKSRNLKYVYTLIINNIEPNYWRGYQDGERKTEREIRKVIEASNLGQKEEQKKGIFSR